MESVAAAFERAVQKLNLDPQTGDRIKARRDELLERLRQSLNPKALDVAGSYGRRTSIRPLHDVDLFLIFAQPRDLPLPTVQLQHVEGALRGAYRGFAIRQQRRSVNLFLPDIDVGFDVVPAFETAKPHVFQVPDRRGEERAAGWISTNPLRHAEVAESANERAGKKLKPLVRIVKFWSGLQGKPVPSFLLEAIAYRAPLAQHLGYAAGLSSLFTFLSEQISRPCHDPAGVGPNIETGISSNNIEQARQRLSGAARQAALALADEEKGATAAAHERWSSLLPGLYEAR